LFILSKLSLKNRAVVALITVIVAAFGFLSVGSLKQELIPSIEIPSAAIVTSYPGASPEVVDAQVSSVIENAVIGLDGLESTTATSTTGLSVLRVSFQFGTTTETAIERLNSAIAAVESQLPSDSEPRVISGSFDSVPIIVLAIADLDGDNERIGATLEKVAPNLFRQVDGIRDVVVSGSKQKQINLEIDQFALASSGLSQQSITQALQANGLVLPVGSLTDDQGSIAIQMGTAVETVEQIEALPLISPSPQPGASVVTIGDVAVVTYEQAPITSIARTNGRESLAVSITKTPDGNSVAVSNGVQDLVPELEAALGGNVSVVTTFDQAPFIEKSIKDLTVEGLLGLTFAVIVILVFLLSIKSTLITAISIPTSVLITFIGLQSADYSLNLLTLGALTISIGRVVDDSIVVIENINRHLSYGEKRKTAVLTAVKEVAGAITASTITTVAVFLPIALVDGLVGELFRPFAFTAGIALLASLLVSLTIVPVLAYWFLRMPKRLRAVRDADPKKFEKKQRQHEEEREQKSLLQRIYLPALNGTRNHPFITLTAAVLLLAYTFSLVPLLKTNFIDGGGSNQFNARVEMPASTSLEEQDAAAAEIEASIQEIEGVEVVQTTIGTAADGRVAFGASGTGISMSVTASEGFEVEDIRSEVLGLETPTDTAITVSSGGGFGSSETIDIEVLASDNELLTEAVEKLVDGLQGINSVSSVTSTLDADERVLEIVVDREKAAEYLLTENVVSGIVASQLRPQPLGQVRIEGVETPLYVDGQAAPESISEIRALQIPTFQGPVRLDALASVEEVLKPTSITSERGNRTARVSLAPEGDDLGAITAAITERFETIELPIGVEASIGGAAADQAESFEQLGIALLAAVAIVYIVMVATFGSLIQPLLLLISIPFAAIGALGLLILTDTALGVPALIGMLMLIGIVVTNAIVLIDLVNQYRRQGRSVEDSLVSGARQRLRPILMTALATIFALTPMAFGLTGDSGFISQPLAIVVIGGLVSSTLLTLILVPTLYWLVEGRKERKVIRQRRKEQKALAKTAKSQAKLSRKAGQTATVEPVSAMSAAPMVVTTVIEREPEQAPAPEPVQTEAPSSRPWSPGGDEPHVNQGHPTLPAEQRFEPAVLNDSPPLAWSDENEIQAASDIEIDDESSMRWSEEEPQQAPAAADANAGLPEFLTQEIPLIQEQSESKRDKKRREKAERKAQKRAARESRHAND
jgi:HAE1 family hydrophobic/amphiphilic exporter-1